MGWLFWLQVSQLTFVVVAFLFLLWQGPPPIISSDEIYVLADVLLMRFGEQAEAIAFLLQEKARHERDFYEQEKWRQVGERIEVLRRDDLYRCHSVSDKRQTCHIYYTIG